jgi:hypothetical protein
MCVVGLNCLITLTMCFGVSLTKQFVLLLFLHERFDGHQLKITTTHLGFCDYILARKDIYK